MGNTIRLSGNDAIFSYFSIWAFASIFAALFINQLINPINIQWLTT